MTRAITNKMKKNGWLLFISLTLSSCFKEADFSGFIRSTDRSESCFKESMEWNSNHPFKIIETDNESYKVLVTSDVHVGGADTYENFLKFIDRSSQPDITAAVYVGDLSSGRKEHQELFKSLLPQDSVVQSFPIAGNHDLYFDGWDAFYSVFGSSTYYFTIKTPSKQDLYICLNSGNGTHGSSQIAWLKNLLETQRNHYDRCVIFSHCNFFRTHHTPSTSPNMDEILVLMDLFETHTVDMVINGHDHKRDEKQLGLCKYIILDALRDDANNASYMVLQKTNTSFKYEFVKP
ncbi:MAG: metallophosphoesterase [Bacteroidetes bacterium]|nr:metallophosphoesterase [Bacteroidota bacterium]